MSLITLIKKQSVKLTALLVLSTPFLAFAEANDKGIAGVTKNLTEAATSFGPLISIAAFIVGMGALFKAVTTIMNHSENPRENPLKNVVFYGLAAAVGLGYTFSTTTLVQTLFEKDKSEAVDDKIFKVN
ncbi:hypothetical protein [Photobacterium galatheae]|uniref:Uncharacterized protein n=2 Tax=Photobacterium galatheae TaxID=1654360 RepID=A0A066RU67_9GAMM|nr:hypothetical protein [Photobacterium galatheae]KDM90933.1 hypothetical protein EA58_14350 [Photobacterium galatheae]